MNVGFFTLYWARQNFSAASVRSFGILHSFIKTQSNIYYITTAKPNTQEQAELSLYGMIKKQSVKLEDPQTIKNAFKSIQGQLDVAIFDTFIAEEFFSHYVHKKYPQCLKIVDLQDFHSLRKLRGFTLKNIQEEKQNIQKLNQNNISVDLNFPSPEFQQKILESKEIQQSENKDLHLHESRLKIVDKDDVFKDLNKIMTEKPNSLNSEIFSRELASMVRSDMILSCSDFEQNLLEQNYKLKNVNLITFFYEEIQNKEKLRDLRRRKNFVWIGNQTHEPNDDSLRILVNKIWPEIHKRLPDAQLHIFGSNFQREFSNLESRNQNIRSGGLLDRISRLQNYRVLLAPLRFGAGIKGKITDSWYYGLPVVTTPIGGEGMFYFSSQEQENYGQIDKNEIFLKEKIKKVVDQEAIDQSNKLRLYYSQIQNQEKQEQIQMDQKQLEEFGFGGSWNNQTEEQFIENSVKLYENDEEWIQAQEKGFQIIEKRMKFERNDILLQKNISQNQTYMQDNRRNNYLQQLTWSETLRSTEHLSKYVEEKNKSKNNNNFVKNKK